MEAELKPCPFCGKSCAVVSNTREMSRPSSCFMYTVVCDATQDGCGVTCGYEFEEADAIAAWNTRHGAGDADRSAELTTAWMAGAESVRDRAARDADDAARYRWLREHVTDRFVRNNEHEPCLLLPHNVDYLSPDEIDAAIDAARAGERGVAGG